MSEIILAITAISILAAWVYTISMKEKEIKHERAAWQVERQQLLDRIQAPSFDHLKQAEVRVIKTSKEPAKDPNPLEVV